MTTPDITIAFLRRKYGGSVDQYFDADGDGVADTDVVDQFMASATIRARDSLYGSGFTDAVVDQLATSNERYQEIVALFTMAKRASTKQEWMMSNGRWPWEIQANEAEAELERIAKGTERLHTEETQGSSRMLGSRARPVRELVFAASEANPKGPGGY